MHIKLDTEAMGPEEKKILDFMKDRIKGQDRALRYIAQAWNRFFSPLRNPDKPIFSGLLLGPAGVGKTLLAETIAEYICGDPKGFTKIDCAELSEPHEVARLKGSPPGYVGYVSQEDDPSGSRYVLSQYSIDKYHLQHLAETHKKEAKDLRTKSKEVGEESKKNSELEKELEARLKQCRKRSLKLEKRLAFIKSKKQNSPGLEKAIHKLRLEKASLEKRIKEINAHISQRRLEFFYRWKKASEEGWIFDPENPVWENIFSVILFDEIDKADEAIYHLLLEIMDKGRFQLGNGSVTYFKNSLILMTGNIGSQFIGNLLDPGNKLGFRSPTEPEFADIDKQIYETTMEEAAKVFRPEFLGRVDKKIIFRPLSYQNMKDILDMLIGRLNDSLARNGHPVLIVEDPAKNYILGRALKYPQEGAREIETRFNDYIKDKLISLIQNNQAAKGDIITVKLEESGDDQKIIFYKEEIKK